MPAPTPQATSTRRCGGGTPAHRARAAAIAPPVCFTAASRPSDMPRPTATIDSTARATVPTAATRPDRNQMAALTSPAGAERPPHQQPADADPDAGDAQHEHPPGRRGAPDGIEQVVVPGPVRPGQVLDGVQQQHEPAAGQPGPDAGDDHDAPKDGREPRLGGRGGDVRLRRRVTGTGHLGRYVRGTNPPASSISCAGLVSGRGRQGPGKPTPTGRETTAVPRAFGVTAGSVDGTPIAGRNSPQIS